MAWRPARTARPTQAGCAWRAHPEEVFQIECCDYNDQPHANPLPRHVPQPLEDVYLHFSRCICCACCRSTRLLEATPLCSAQPRLRAPTLRGRCVQVAPAAACMPPAAGSRTHSWLWPGTRMLHVRTSALGLQHTGTHHPERCRTLVTPASRFAQHAPRSNVSTAGSLQANWELYVCCIQ